jgi:hypothetical protein
LTAKSPPSLGAAHSTGSEERKDNNALAGRRSDIRGIDLHLDVRGGALVIVNALGQLAAVGEAFCRHSTKRIRRPMLNASKIQTLVEGIRVE